MHRVEQSLLALGILLFPVSALTQNLSTEIFPSEDELLQALELGEISFEQFIRLQEIAVIGVDSATQFLLDEIPNLSYFQRDSASSRPLLQSEQRSGFNRRSRFSNGSVSWQFYQRLEEKGRGDESRYRFSGDMRPSENWRVEFRVNREWSGRERWVRRTLTYSSRTGLLKRLRLGSFSQRLGLGTIIGYRGKLLAPSAKLDSESFLFPDYGGHNGILAELSGSKLSGSALLSFIRDPEHSLLTLGGRVGAATGKLRPSVVVGLNHVRNRTTGKSLNDFKLGMYSTYRYAEGYASVEVSAQTANSSGFAAIAGEGRHTIGESRIQYAGWIYGDKFLDLSSGSKSATISRRIDLEDTGLSISSRRSGQKGLLMRTRVPLSARWRLHNSLLIGGVNRDSVRTEFSTGFSSVLSRKLSVEFTYLGKFRSSLAGGQNAAAKNQQVRLTTRYKTDRVRLRAYLAHNTRSGRRDFLSALFVARIVTRQLGRYELWSNIARLERNGLDYWYLYLKAEQLLTNGIMGTIKFAHTYARSALDRSRPVLSFRLEAAL